MCIIIPSVISACALVSEVNVLNTINPGRTIGGVDVQHVTGFLLKLHSVVGNKPALLLLDASRPPICSICPQNKFRPNK